MSVHDDGSASLKLRLRLSLHHGILANPLLGLRVDLFQIPEAVLLVQVMAEGTGLNPRRHKQPVGQIGSPFYLNGPGSAALVVRMSEEDVEHCEWLVSETVFSSPLRGDVWG